MGIIIAKVIEFHENVLLDLDDSELVARIEGADVEIREDEDGNDIVIVQFKDDDNG